MTKVKFLAGKATRLPTFQDRHPTTEECCEMKLVNCKSWLTTRPGACFHRDHHFLNSDHLYKYHLLLLPVVYCYPFLTDPTPPTLFHTL